MGATPRTMHMDHTVCTTTQRKIRICHPKSEDAGRRTLSACLALRLSDWVTILRVRRGSGGYSKAPCAVTVGPAMSPGPASSSRTTTLSRGVKPYAFLAKGVFANQLLRVSAVRNRVRDEPSAEEDT